MFNRRKKSELSMQDQNPAPNPSSSRAEVEFTIKNEDMGDSHEKNDEDDTKSLNDTNTAPTSKRLVAKPNHIDCPDSSAVEHTGPSLVVPPTIAEAPASSHTTAINIATLHPHRTGSLSLPLLPVFTSTHQIPQRFCAGSTHLTSIHEILTPLAIPLHTPPQVLHRYHAHQAQAKNTLTLVIQSHSSARNTWPEALRALESYLAKHKLGLCVEIIDYRIFRGMYTLPILATDPLAKFVAKRKSGVGRVLDEELGQEGWTSCGFWYRGVGGARGECTATVVVGVKGVGGKVVRAVERVREKAGGSVEVEVVWRKGGKW